MKRVTDIMKRLRAKDGCPWDREQTLETLREHLLEETYEVLDAMQSGDPRKHMEELGDLLLQVVFQGADGTEAPDVQSIAFPLSPGAKQIVIRLGTVNVRKERTLHSDYFL